MRAALTPPLVAAAQVVFSRLSLVNLCVAATPLGGEFIVLGNTPLGLVSLAPVRKSLTLQNVHWFTPSWNLHADLYVCGVQRLLSVFPSGEEPRPCRAGRASQRTSDASGSALAPPKVSEGASSTQPPWLAAFTRALASCSTRRRVQHKTHLAGLRTRRLTPSQPRHATR